MGVLKRPPKYSSHPSFEKHVIHHTNFLNFLYIQPTFPSQAKQSIKNVFLTCLSFPHSNMLYVVTSYILTTTPYAGGRFAGSLPL